VPEPPESTPGVFAELKRRKVVRTGLVYGAFSFAVLQVADIVVEPLGLPLWTMPAVIWVLLIGLPITLIVSWFVEMSGEEEADRQWLSLRTGGVILALVTLGVVAGWFLRPEAAGPAAVPDGGEEVDANAVVVLPFSVLGSEEWAYLSDAVAKLLGTSLDGTAGLRTVSSHAIMGYPGLQDPGEVTEALAREVAAHFGAGLLLIGDVIEAGDSLRIEATLVDRLAPDAEPVSATVTAAEDDLFAAVDQLATLLVAEREAGAGSDRTRIAALTTSSLEALRAYIEGERAYRAGSFLPAVDAFTRAVEADTAFALAFYRLSMAEERLAWAEPSRRSAEAAYRHGQRLSDRERGFLEAVVALRRGNTSEAEQMLRAHVRRYPDDPEAWYQLGEILFHGEPLRGGSMTAGREPFENALFYDPGDLGALYHLVRIAVKDGDAARIDELTQRFVALSPSGGRTLELRALQAASQADATGFDGILEEMEGSPDIFLPIAVWSLATFGQDPSGAESIAGLMTGRDRPQDVRGAGHVQLAHLALAQGRYTDAIAELDAAEALGDPDAAESRAWFAALPFTGSGGEDLREAGTRLDARRTGPSNESPRPSSFFSAQNGVHEPVGLYLAGILAALAGDAEAAAMSASELESVAGTEGARELARQLAVGVAAQTALAASDTARSLGLLEGLDIEGWYELTFVSPYYAGALERFTLAELLFATGREEEALGWYQGLRENNVAELAFTGPTLLREATIHRHAGRAEQAQALEARFESLWAEADADLRQSVAERYGSVR